MISSRNKGTLADSYIAKGETKLNQANTVGFIRIQGKTNQNMGFIGHSAKPSHSWVHKLSIVNPTFTFKDQSSQHMGLSNCTQSSHLIVGFIKLPSQANIHNWVYQTVQPKVTHKVKLNKTQPSQYMGLSGYQPSHLSSWVYQDSKAMGRKNY